jgi:hypothetical protein
MRRRRLSTYRPRLSLTRIAAFCALIKLVSACRPGCAYTVPEQHPVSATCRALTRAIALIVERVHAKVHMKQSPAQSEGGAGHVSCEIVEPRGGVCNSVYGRCAYHKTSTAAAERLRGFGLQVQQRKLYS